MESVLTPHRIAMCGKPTHLVSEVQKKDFSFTNIKRLAEAAKPMKQALNSIKTIHVSNQLCDFKQIIAPL